MGLTQGNPGKAPFDEGSMVLGGSEAISSVWRLFSVGLLASLLAKPRW